jgi:hypothetical protein
VLLSATVNPEVCGEQFAAQSFVVAGGGSGSATAFVVRTIGYARPYDTTATVSCRSVCVLSASTNTAGAGIAYVADGFR